MIAPQRPGDRAMRHGRDDEDPPPRRRGREVPRWATALLLAMVAVLLVGLAIVAARVGPLRAHPPTSPPDRPAPPPEITMTRPTMPTVATEPGQGPDGSWLWWVGGILAGLVVLFLVLALLRALRRLQYRMTRPPAAAAAPPSGSLSIGWATPEPETDATDARTFDPERAADDIIASWTVLERAAAQLGHGRRPANTPTEFLAALTARLGSVDMPAGDGSAGDGAGDAASAADDRAGAAAGAAEVLLHLYHRARFDVRALDPSAAQQARAAVRALVDAWRLRPSAERQEQTAGPPGADRTPGRHR